MRHRFTRFAVHIICVALPIGLSACSDQIDPASPDPDSVPPNVVQAAAASLAVEDALARLIPNLTHAGQAAALEQSLRELAAAMAGSNDAVTTAALDRTRAALDHYASSNTADEADVDAIRLAIAVHAATANPQSD